MQETSPALLWTGRALSALVTLALAASGGAKLAQAPEIVQNLTNYGYDPEQITTVGILELSFVALYAIPKTAVLGGILVAAYCGAAAAAHITVNEAPVAPIVVAILAWTGLGLREPRLRALLPLR